MPNVTNITYNQYGERQRIDYGNGTFTEYAYDDLRRMQNLEHQFFGVTSTYTVEKEYAYDKVSNVIQIETLNNGQLLPNTEDGVLAGPILHNYYYDDFNRLIGADGWYVGPDDEPSALLRQEYTLDMAYDESHNILNKAQNHLRGSADPNDTSLFLNNISEAMEDTAYNLDYEDYASGSFTTGGHSYVQPHAPRTIVEYPYGAGADEPSAKRKLLDYDANGNLLLVEQEISDPEDPLGKAKISLRENLWDEENRLLAVDLKPEAPSNKPEVAAYTYDASGERTIKYLPGRLDAYYSAKAAGSADRLESILYPSPLLTVKTLPLPEEMNEDELQRKSITKYTKHYYIGTERIASALGTMHNLGLLCENVWPGSQDIIDEMGTKTIDAGDVLIADYDAFEKELQLSEPFIYETYLLCVTGDHEPENYDAYWYHPDHLGSSSYITNLAGEVSQHMEYLPFGETLVEEHLNSYNSPYKFNAKEFDAETGWYYYGARYYSPKYNLMLGVDPASDLYPGWSPYVYTLQNPVRYVDPTGMVVEDPPTEAGKYEGQTHYDPDTGATYEWDGKGTWHSDMGGTNELGEVVVTASSNPNDISNGADSHIVPSFGVSQDLGAIGSTTNGGLALPQDFGSWDRVGSDGRQWIGCMACHGNNGAYRTLAYNSPSRYTGLSLAATFNAAFMYGQTVAPKTVSKLSIRADIVLSGGRSGQLVKTLTGPANSVVKGGQGRIFITDDVGKVIWDVTKDRAKSVIPGQGFGPKVAPSNEQLNLLKQVWGY